MTGLPMYGSLRGGRYVHTNINIECRIVLSDFYGRWAEDINIARDRVLYNTYMYECM